MKKFKFQFKFHRSKKLSSQLLHHIASSNSSLTSFSLIKTMYQLPYDSSQALLIQYKIDDHQHFFEHLKILKSNAWLKDMVLKQLMSLSYPFMMFLTSTILFHIFHHQFQPILKQMSLNVSLEITLLKGVHILVLTSLLLIIIFLFWIQKAMYRKVMCLQLFRSNRIVKALLEWEFMSVVNSHLSSSFSIQRLISLMKAHQNNPILSILSYELKEHIELGENMLSWITKLSLNPTMSYWLEEQITTQHMQNCSLWQDQLQFALQHYFIRLKLGIQAIIYILIAFNIMGMISLLTLPYEWMVTL